MKHECMGLVGPADEQAWQILQANAAAIKEAADIPKGERRWAVLRVCEATGWSPAKVYRKLIEYDHAGTVEALAREKPGPKKGSSKLTAEQDEVIFGHLRKRDLSKQRPRLCVLALELEEIFLERGWLPVHRETIKRRIGQFDERERVLKREGAKAAYRFKAKPGRYIVDRPNQVWQIDHSPLNYVIVDTVTRKPIGRPWLTAVIDIATRIIVGFVVSLDPPSRTVVKVALMRAIEPKEQWLEDLGFDDVEWPARGLPEALHSDNAAEFRAASTRRALENQQSQVIYRHPGSPEEGGHVESFLGSIAKASETVPGATFSSPAARGEYDSEGRAVLTFADAERWVAAYILKIYHYRDHSALRMSPLEAWKIKAEEHGFVPRFPLDPWRFQLDLMPFDVRTVTPEGIRLHNVFYYSAELKPYINSKDAKRVVRFDPRDLSQIWVETGEQGRVIEVPLKWDDRTRFTYWEYEMLMRRRRGQRRKVTPQMVFDGLREQRRLIEEATAGKARARRAEERLRQTPPSAPHSAVKPTIWDEAAQAAFEQVFGAQAQ